jgi:hypothetical protein
MSGGFRVQQDPLVDPPSEASMKLAHAIMLAPDIGSAARLLDDFVKRAVELAVKDCAAWQEQRDKAMAALHRQYLKR